MNFVFINTFIIMLCLFVAYKMFRKEKIKTTYTALFLLILFMIYGVPIIIYKNFTTESIPNASEILSYYGDVLSFLGTVLLGGLALWQTHFYKKTQDSIEKRNSIPELKIELIGDINTGRDLKISITNICRYDITKVVCEAPLITDEFEFVKINSFEKIIIDLEDYFYIDLETAKNATNFNALFKFECQDIYGELHYFAFEIYYYSMMHNGRYIILRDKKIEKQQFDSIKNSKFKSIMNEKEYSEFKELKEYIFG